MRESTFLMRVLFRTIRFNLTTKSGSNRSESMHLKKVQNFKIWNSKKLSHFFKLAIFISKLNRFYFLANALFFM